MAVTDLHGAPYNSELVIADTERLDDVTNRRNVGREQQRAQDRALGHASGTRRRTGRKAT